LKFFILFILMSQVIFADFTIDHKVKKSHAWILTSHYDVPYIMGYSLIGGFLIEGNSETRFGKTTTKALDSFIWTNLTVEAMKKTFRRVRPRNAKTPNEWFVDGHNSFPSGHVASVTASVVPYILEYKKDYPLIHLLWFFPLQQMAGRVNAQAHWQSDVLTSVLVGGLIGYYTFKQDKPLFLYFVDDGIFVGFRYRF